MSDDNLGVPQYFKVQKLCFKGIGIDIRNQRHIVTNYFLMIVPGIGALTLGASMFHYAGKHLKEVDEVTDALGPVCQIVLSTLKWMTFMYKRKEMVRLVNRVWAWNLEANEDERDLLVKANESDIRFCSVYLKCVAITGIMVAMKPFFAAIVSHIHSQHFYLDPLAKASYPLDIKKPLNYFLCALWVGVAMNSVLFTSVGVDSLFSWIANNVIAQFGILKLRLQKVALENGGKPSAESIIRCVKYHRRIIAIVDELNTVYGIVIFVKFIISCMQICSLAYQLSRLSKLVDAPYQLAFLFSVSLQLIMYCRNGQYIINESSNVSSHIYNIFDWPEVSLTSRQLLLIFMMRAQRFSSLSGILFIMDLSLYLWVFRSAGSFITFLFTMDKK